MASAKRVLARNVIGCVSGKGGVGKSTTAVRASRVCATGLA